MRESDDYLRRLALCRQALIANWGWTLPLSPKQDQLAQEWAVALGLASFCRGTHVFATSALIFNRKKARSDDRRLYLYVVALSAFWCTSRTTTTGAAKALRNTRQL